MRRRRAQVWVALGLALVTLALGAPGVGADIEDELERARSELQGIVDEIRAEQAMLIITCCVSDATVAQIRVVNVPPGQFEVNDWVEVTGEVIPLGREVIVNATEMIAVPRPDPPYLTP